MGRARKMVARVLIVLTIVFRGSLSQFCNTAERFPNYIKEPGLDHSGNHISPTITICRKGPTDSYHLCHCYDSSGEQHTSHNENNNEVTYYCCQCPEITREKYYKQFEKFEIGDGTNKNWLNFKLSNMARELHIQRCNEAILSDIKNIENLTIINTNTLKLDIRNAQSSLDVNVRGKRKPRFLNRNVGTHLEAASLDRLRNISLVNVKADKLPKQMHLNSLMIESSYIKNGQNHPFFDNVRIKKMTVKNSDIDSIDHLGLFQSENNIESLRFMKNQINNVNDIHDCDSSCFFPEKFIYKSNKVTCGCSKNSIKCEKKAITKFNCPANIVDETKCMELQVKSTPVNYKFLIDHKISEVCEKFNKEILKLDLRYVGDLTDPPIPLKPKPHTAVLVICCSLVGIIGLGAASMFLYKRKNQMTRRRCASTIYKRTTKDDEEEGTPLE